MSKQSVPPQSPETTTALATNPNPALQGIIRATQERFAEVLTPIVMPFLVTKPSSKFLSRYGKWLPSVRTQRRIVTEGVALLVGVGLSKLLLELAKKFFPEKTRLIATLQRVYDEGVASAWYRASKIGFDFLRIPGGPPKSQVEFAVAASNLMDDLLQKGEVNQEELVHVLEEAAA